MIRWINKIIKREANNIRETIDLIGLDKICNEVTNMDIKVNILEWVKYQNDSGVPLNAIMDKLMKESGQINELELLSAKRDEYMDAANKIQDIFVSKNLDGIQFEKDGADNKAIQLYEENIKDRLVGSHPYERLRIIYTRKKRYEDVIRVCKSYIDNGQHDPQLKAKYEEIIRTS